MKGRALLMMAVLLMLLMGSAAAKPDLGSSDEAIVFEAGGGQVSTVMAGETLNISVRISNTGDQPANFSVEFYDGNPAEGGVLIDTVQSHVNQSDYSTVSTTWNIPADAKGDHEIWVMIDPDNEVDEINEANNEYHRTIFVQIPGSMELGLHVMAVGLTVVLVSLLTLSLVLHLLGKLAARYDARHPVKPAAAGADISSATDDSEKAAVIAAAIEAYEEDRGGD